MTPPSSIMISARMKHVHLRVHLEAPFRAYLAPECACPPAGTCLLCASQVASAPALQLLAGYAALVIVAAINRVFYPVHRKMGKHSTPALLVYTI